METKLISCTTVCPMPMMDEQEREKRAEALRQNAKRHGLIIAKESWVRNPVFDKKGEKTTLKFKLKVP